MPVGVLVAVDALEEILFQIVVNLAIPTLVRATETNQFGTHSGSTNPCTRVWHFAAIRTRGSARPTAYYALYTLAFGRSFRDGPIFSPYVIDQS